MLESDADRLASIKGLGGQLVRSGEGEFWAIFDEEYSPALQDGSIDSTFPALTCRSSDLTLLGIRRGAEIKVLEGDFKVLRQEKGDAPGWSIVRLSK